MDSKRIPGEGIAHEQNYIEERMIDASDVGELGEQNEKLKEELRDLKAADPAHTSPSDAALEATANAPTMQSELADEARTSASVGPLDTEQLPPISSARSEVVDEAGGNQSGS